MSLERFYISGLFFFQNGLYQSENQEERQSSFELDVVAQSQNPLLKNLTDFLIEEASAEEEELLGISSGEYFVCLEYRREYHRSL